MPSQPHRSGYDAAADPAVITLPPTESDPLAYLAPTDIIVSVHHTELVIPATDAYGWLHVLWADDFTAWDVVPGMCPDGEDVVSTALLNDWISPRDLELIALEAV